MKDVRSGSSILFVCVDVQLAQHCFLERLSFPHCLALALLSSEDVLIILCGSVPGSPLCCANLSVLLPVPSCLDLSSFRVSKY